MLPTVNRQRVIHGSDEMAASHVPLIDERDQWAELQIAPDAEGIAVELIVSAIFIARIGVAAMLHAVAELVEGLGRERRLQRGGINEIAQPERAAPFDVRDGQPPFASLP